MISKKTPKGNGDGLATFAGKEQDQYDLNYKDASNKYSGHHIPFYRFSIKDEDRE